jgi:hypothetical protein
MLIEQPEGDAWFEVKDLDNGPSQEQMSKLFFAKTMVTEHNGNQGRHVQNHQRSDTPENNPPLYSIPS